MSRSLKSIDKQYGRKIVLETISRRLTSKETGLGYLAAMDAQEKIKSIEAKIVPKIKPLTEEISEL